MEIVGQLVDAGGNPVAASRLTFVVADFNGSPISSSVGEILPSSNRGTVGGSARWCRHRRPAHGT